MPPSRPCWAFLSPAVGRSADPTIRRGASLSIWMEGLGSLYHPTCPPPWSFFRCVAPYGYGRWMSSRSRCITDLASDRRERCCVDIHFGCVSQFSGRLDTDGGLAFFGYAWILLSLYGRTEPAREVCWYHFWTRLSIPILWMVSLRRMLNYSLRLSRLGNSISLTEHLNSSLDSDSLSGPIASFYHFLWLSLKNQPRQLELTLLMGI
jgi:hypothetical protein